MKFLTEDSHGQNSKLYLEDAHGEKWTAKLGVESQPETVASRLLWAVGYFANDDYYFDQLQVDGLPAHLKRGQGHVVAPGVLAGVRMQRHPGKQEKSAWNWKHNPFVGTREFNGLRVMMALISNWDLKDDNNAVYRDSKNGEHWMVSDVGTAFGASGMKFTEHASKNNLENYRKSRFIAKVTPAYVDIDFPQRPPLLYIFVLPSYLHQVHLRWIGKHIPKEDAKWVGSLLGQLSTRQIQDAFRAAGYSQAQVAGFTHVLQARIAALNNL
ncbi:MAG TPA: hypothetical protein VFP59_03320 [Candidatus Angelobacter sp.]|nr:hypothetical protein [Candidatus Angelobacter sp.]